MYVANGNDRHATLSLPSAIIVTWVQILQATGKVCEMRREIQTRIRPFNTTTSLLRNNLSLGMAIYFKNGVGYHEIPADVGVLEAVGVQIEKIKIYTVYRPHNNINNQISTHCIPTGKTNFHL